jgi:hypothetical protein
MGLWLTFSFIEPMKPHTPGPFPLKITQVDDFFVIITNQGNHYAKTFDPAAAHLIASAPEMLDALALIYANAGESPEWIRARIAPVIEKANGGKL